jgi:hypothetical protein
MTFVVPGGVSGLGIEPEPVSRQPPSGRAGRTLLLGSRKG